MTVVAVPPDRFLRWTANFTERHGATGLAVAEGRLVGTAQDGSTYAAALPFSRAYDGAADPAALLAAAVPPEDWSVLLVRKGGFAIARLHAGQVRESKVGQRHVQGRTKAGGQSQQRFARRRDNQARAAYEAAAEHAARLVADAPLVVVGGDQGAVAATLEDPRLRVLRSRVAGPFLTVADPRRAVLEDAIRWACSLSVDVVNA